jgi:hypothetical protein
MEWGIVPGQPFLVHQPFEPGNARLGDLRCLLLEIRVAKINPTAQRPGSSGRASSPIVLPGASGPVIEWSRRSRGVGQEQGELRARDEQGVTVLLEPATSAADRADGRLAGDLGVDVGIDALKCFPEEANVEPTHEVWTRAAVARISSTVKSCPCPDPGQIVVMCSQSSGDSRFSGQNGQVRHWTGRAS